MTALAALAAAATFAAHAADPVDAAEAAFLGRMAALVLAAVAVLAPPPAWEVGLGAALATAAIWGLPAGPGRGAVVAALLAGALSVAGCRRLQRLRTARGGAEPERRRLGAARVGTARIARQGRLRREVASPAGGLVAAAALCLGWQALLRGELLFAPGHALRPWTALLALPPVAGIAVALLWQCRGMLPALAAAGAAAVLAPGWTVGTTLALVALAGGSVLAVLAGGAFSHGAGATAAGTEEPRGGEDGAGKALADAASPGPASLPGSAPARGAGPMARRLRQAAGVAALLLPVAWQPRSGWAAAVAGLALWRPGLALVLAVIAGIGGRLLAQVHGTPMAHLLGGSAPVFGPAWLLALLPALVVHLFLPPGRRRAAMLATAVVLAGTVPWLPDRSVLAAPLALAALTLPAGGVAAGLSAVWGAALLLGTALLASYPWLRQDPLGDAVALLGLPPGPRLAGSVALAALVLAGSVGLFHRLRADGGRGGVFPRRPAGGEGLPRGGWAAATLPAKAAMAAWAAGAVLLAVLAVPPLVHPASALLTPGASVLLDHAHPSWHIDLGPQPTAGVVLLTSLVNASGLTPRTPVARVRLLGTGGATAEWPLRAGLDTGEWAARRPDVAAAARLPAPRPWQAWVAGGFFGQSYRAHLALPRAASFVRLEIDLAPGLPPETALALHQVEMVETVETSP